MFSQPKPTRLDALRQAGCSVRKRTMGPSSQAGLFSQNE
jgi:hypothetical protein